MNKIKKVLVKADGFWKKGEKLYSLQNARLQIKGAILSFEPHPSLYE